ncbi:MAG: GNAT family N-acetyltransferase [Pirellulales bacterium]|nr:GNAT family N-acetyltransferase [Pirellulales bacterium]
MRITVIPGDQLTSQHVACWSQLQRANPQLDSPYFCPEFVQFVAAVRSDVAVGILEMDDQIVGFFPFQRDRWNIGRPVGTPLSDFQGVVTTPEMPFHAEELIRGCGLGAWQFDHLLADQQPFCSYHRTVVPSPFIDLSGGFEAYKDNLRRGGPERFSSIRRNVRAAERCVGPVRFEFHAADSGLFQQLIQWKTAQYEREKLMNVFTFPWAVNLLEQIRDFQDEAFSGVPSALYFGDQLAAVHFGMRSRNVLHYWYPAYNPDLARYSPGMICLVEIAKTASSQGIQRIDLGKGCEPYKMSLMSDATNVAEGNVLVHHKTRVLSQICSCARGLSRVPILGIPIRWTAQRSRPLRQRWMFR